MGRFSEVKSYAKPQEIGAIMGGGTAGVVEASNNPRFHPGDAVFGMGGWQRYSLSDGKGLRLVDAKAVPIQAYLGPLGMPGVTAWYGLNRIIAPKAERRCWSRRRPARSARWSASSPSSPARGPSASLEAREMRLRGQGAGLSRLGRPQIVKFR